MYLCVSPFLFCAHSQFKKKTNKTKKINKKKTEYNIFAVSSKDIEKYEWNELKEYLYKVHSDWESRDNKKITNALKSIHILMNELYEKYDSDQKILMNDGICLNQCQNIINNIILDKQQMEQLKYYLESKFNRVE